MKKEVYLSEFQTIANSITEKYIGKFDKTDLAPDEFIILIADDFKKELAEKGTEIFHKSIMNGVDDNLGLIKGLQNTNFESVVKLRTKIGK